MIENINEIKYPVIVAVDDDHTYLYENPSSGGVFDNLVMAYYPSLPIQEEDTICTKEFLQGKYVRVKCLEEFNFVKELALNGGFGFKCIYDLITKATYLTFYDGFVVNHSEKPVIGKELILPFPDSIYQKEDFVSEEFLSQANRPTTEALSQDFSHPEGDSLAESLHTLAERYTLFYTFHPREGDYLKSYFLVDYKEVSYKVDSVAKVGDLEKMIMIEKGLCYE